MSTHVTIDRMARFLFVVVPVTARLWPAVAIGDALAAQGHDVAWCGPESVLRPIIGPGMAIYSTGKRSYRELREVGTAGVRELWDQYVVPLNRFIQRPVDLAVAQYQPDVVVADQYALTGALSAIKHGTVWATLCAGPLELTPHAAVESLQGWIRSRLAQVSEAAGVPAGDGLDLRFSPYLVIATTARALTGTAPMPPNCLLVGAALGARRTDPAFSWDRWDPGRPHVLVTVGTLSSHLADDFAARMMAALEPLADRVQVVLNTSADAMPNPPPHVVVAPRIPMLELWPRLDAVVCQAGQSTVNEALAHGVPLVLVPIRLNEATVAQQVTRAGAGVQVSYATATAAQLTAAMTAVLDEPGYRDQARRLSAEYAAAGGTEAAAASLAALATAGSAETAQTAV
jgi:zeaxanthin glucosyltransferase